MFYIEVVCFVPECVRGNDFRVVRVPQDCRNRTLSLQGFDTRATVHVPELDRAVSGTATSHQRVALPRAPGHALNGSSVLFEGEERSGLATDSVPNVNRAMLRAAGQATAVTGTLERAHAEPAVSLQC